jgi:hypothetical protein
MDFDAVKKEAEQGEISKEYVSYLKNLFIGEILRGESRRVTNALMAYAHFLNREGISSDNYPIFLKILESNNRYAINALIEGYDIERYLDVVTPNRYLVECVFSIFSSYRRNELYEITLRVLLGFLLKTYRSAEVGWQVYNPSIANVNNLGKILDESKDQDDNLNRDILDVLQYLSDLDSPQETDQSKKDIARQAGRIRSDYFDNQRRLNQSITDVILEEAEVVSLGMPPEYVYVDA